MAWHSSRTFINSLRSTGFEQSDGDDADELHLEQVPAMPPRSRTILLFVDQILRDSPEADV